MSHTTYSFSAHNSDGTSVQVTESFEEDDNEMQNVINLFSQFLHGCTWLIEYIAVKETNEDYAVISDY